MIHTFSLAVLMVGGFVLVVSLFSSLIKSRLFVTTPLLATLLGAAVGPRALGWFDPATWADPGAVFQVATGLTLAIALMEVALRLPRDFVTESWKGLALLLLVFLPAAWLISGALVHWSLGIPWTMALLIGAMAAPTDPIVATSILSGREAESRLPERIRFLLTAESGANDGLAYALFALPLFALTAVQADLVSRAFELAVLDVGGGIMIGAAVGVFAAYGLQLAERRDYIDRTSILAVTLALSLFVYGLARILGAEPLTAVFVSGLTFNRRVSSDERQAEERVQETVNHFFTLPVFILLGMAIPWEGWAELGPIAPLAVGAILLFRRLPLALLLRPVLQGARDRKDAWIIGWFGPLGVAALALANEARIHTGETLPWSFGTLLIAASVILHGTSATPLIRLYDPPRKREGTGEADEGGQATPEAHDEMRSGASRTAERLLP